MKEAWLLSRGGEAVLVAAAAAATLLIAVVWQLIRRGRGSCRLPPGPRALPVVGNLLELMGGELPHRAMAKLSKKYGPIMFLKLGVVPTVVVSDTTFAKACLSGPNDKVFCSRPSMEVTRRLAFGQSSGISMAPYGAEWRHARKLCSVQLFTSKRVREFEPIRSGEIMALVRRIELQVGQPLNLTQAIASLSEATICKILLGKPMAEISDATLGIDMAMLVRRMIDLFIVPMLGDFIPALGFLDRKLKANLDEVHAQFDTLISQLIHERQQRLPSSPEVIVDVLLENLEREHAKTIIMELMSASIDSSSTTMDWAMAELVRTPQAMSRLQMELDCVTKGESRMIKEEELRHLVYLQAVLKETMRLHPPGPILTPRMSIEECKVGGYIIPKGSTLLTNMWAIGHDPKIWEDPEKFMPERFLTEKGELIDFCGQHFELLPFGTGRRICPGLPLAIASIQSTLANLVHSFEWILPHGHYVNLEEKFGIVSTRAKPLMVIPQMRCKE
ncbi:hypothetical protein GOP47_0028102 [Adiantum capillus-veneris]|nr:hypothetical protein GOP47_0028102 [Adiantum capillus-veneris]